MSFWGELKRRNVVRTGVGYLVAAWLLVQIVSLVLPTFDVPEWVVPTITFLLILMLPVVLIIAWAYEITPEGIKPTALVRPDESIATQTGRRLNYITSGLLIAAIGFMLVNRFVPEPMLDEAANTTAANAAAVNDTAAETPGIRPPDATAISQRLQNSLAVLPFENLSPDPDDAYFAAGLHDEVLNQLAKLRNLRVIARTSVLQYADARRSIPDIAAELNVETVMEGTVRFANDLVRVTTQLIEAESGTHLWSETYELPFADIFAVESDIAMNVANAMLVEFSLEEQRNIEKVPTESPEAYALYLQALYNASPIEMRALLEAAIAVDRDFADAYALIAATYAAEMINTVGSTATSDWNAAAEAALAWAQRARDIDPNVATAYEVIGLLGMWQWRWAEADAAFTRALELAPNNPLMLWDAAWFNAFSGRYDRAITFSTRQLELSPGTTRAYIDNGVANAYAGNLETALQSYRAAIAIDATELLSRQHAGLLEARRGNAAAAIREFEFIERFFDGAIQPVFLPELAIGYERAGRPEEAQRFANQILSRAADSVTGAGSLAMAYLALGDREGLIEQLEAAVERVENNEPDQGFFSLMIIKHNVIGHPMLEESPIAALRTQLGHL